MYTMSEDSEHDDGVWKCQFKGNLTLAFVRSPSSTIILVYIFGIVKNIIWTSFLNNTGFLFG